MLFIVALIGVGLSGLGLGFYFGSKVVYYRNDFNLVFGAYRKLEKTLRQRYPEERDGLGMLLRRHPIRNRRASVSARYLLRIRNRMAHEEGLDQLPESIRAQVMAHVRSLKEAGLI